MRWRKQLLSRLRCLGFCLFSWYYADNLQTAMQWFGWPLTCFLHIIRGGQYYWLNCVVWSQMSEWKRRNCKWNSQLKEGTSGRLDATFLVSELQKIPSWCCSRRWKLLSQKKDNIDDVMQKRTAKLSQPANSTGIGGYLLTLHQCKLQRPCFQEIPLYCSRRTLETGFTFFKSVLQVE